jgi:hypothetical protein
VFVDHYSCDQRNEKMGFVAGRYPTLMDLTVCRLLIGMMLKGLSAINHVLDALSGLIVSF